jgi:hypothetical protein
MSKSTVKTDIRRIFYTIQPMKQTAVAIGDFPRENAVVVLNLFIKFLLKTQNRIHTI